MVAGLFFYCINHCLVKCFSMGFDVLVDGKDWKVIFKNINWLIVIWRAGQVFKCQFTKYATKYEDKNN